MSDEQANAERLDDDVVDEGDYPPEHPLGVDRFGTTGVEEEGGESVRQRAAQEDPRRDLRERDEAVGGLLAPDEEAGLDVEGEALATEGDRPDQLSAEEEAVHLEEPAGERAQLGLDGEALRDREG